MILTTITYFTCKTRNKSWFHFFMIFYDVVWCFTMFYDVSWCFTMFYDVSWCSMMINQLYLIFDNIYSYYLLILHWYMNTHNKSWFLLNLHDLHDYTWTLTHTNKYFSTHSKSKWSVCDSHTVVNMRSKCTNMNITEIMITWSVIIR